MCIAIGSTCTPSRGPLGRAWWRIARTPGRLLPFTAIVHAGIIAAIAVLHPEVLRQAPLPVLAAMALAVTSLFALGPLMERFPRWAERSALHYLGYAGAAAILFAGLLLAELGLAGHDRLLATGLVLLPAGMLVAVRQLLELYGWIRAPRRLEALAALAGLSTATLALAVLMLAVVVL